MTYVAVAFAVVAYMGPDFLTENAEEEEFIFGLVATEVLGGWDWILLFAVTTSAIASTQTTIIPASRTALSMARRRALPHTLRAHPSEVPDAGRVDVVGRRDRVGLVRRHQPRSARTRSSTRSPRCRS